MSISQQNPVRVFVSHAFEPSDDYHRVFEYLESSHNFYYRNCSDPEQRGTGERDKLKDELRRQISLAEVVIVPSGQYATQREWIDFQLNCAKARLRVTSSRMAPSIRSNIRKASCLYSSIG